MSLQEDARDATDRIGWGQMPVTDTGGTADDVVMGTIELGRVVVALARQVEDLTRRFEGAKLEGDDTFPAADARTEDFRNGEERGREDAENWGTDFATRVLDRLWDVSGDSDYTKGYAAGVGDAR